jgi:hypothetical protein
MAFAPSLPENSGEREFSLLADEVERMRLFNEELDLRAERMDQRARHLAHAMEMRAAELDTREQQLWEEQETLRGEVDRSRALLLSERREYNEYVEDMREAHRENERRLWGDYEARCAILNQRDTALAAREQLQRGREAELAHWQSQLEGREDELATAQAQLSEEREAFERWARRARDEVDSSPVSGPPEGDF